MASPSRSGSEARITSIAPLAAARSSLICASLVTSYWGAKPFSRSTPSFDLPKSKLGVDLEKGFAPQYEVTKEAQIKELRAAAKGAIEVILASDPDREGEAIAWHLAEALRLKDPQRVVFHEITRQAVEAALQNPRLIDRDLVAAQEARRVIDRLVGYQLSPFLWKKVRTGLSAGRVQSV